MAKQIKKTGQRCPMCDGTATAVFEEWTPRKAGAFRYGLHDRPGGGKCTNSDRNLSIAAWPTWALQANEKAIERGTQR